MVGCFLDSCARAPSGQAIAAPLRKVMNSRRLTRQPSSSMKQTEYQIISHRALLAMLDRDGRASPRVLSGTRSRRSAAFCFSVPCWPWRDSSPSRSSYHADAHARNERRRPSRSTTLKVCALASRPCTRCHRRSRTSPSGRRRPLGGTSTTRLPSGSTSDCAAGRSLRAFISARADGTNIILKRHGYPPYNMLMRSTFPR